MVTGERRAASNDAVGVVASQGVEPQELVDRTSSTTVMPPGAETSAVRLGQIVPRVNRVHFPKDGIHSRDAIHGRGLI